VLAKVEERHCSVVAAAVAEHVAVVLSRAFPVQLEELDESAGRFARNAAAAKECSTKWSWRMTPCGGFAEEGQ